MRAERSASGWSRPLLLPQNLPSGGLGRWHKVSQRSRPSPCGGQQSSSRRWPRRVREECNQPSQASPRQSAIARVCRCCPRRPGPAHGRRGAPVEGGGSAGSEKCLVVRLPSPVSPCGAGAAVKARPRCFPSHAMHWAAYDKQPPHGGGSKAEGRQDGRAPSLSPSPSRCRRGSRLAAAQPPSLQPVRPTTADAPL